MVVPDLLACGVHRYLSRPCVIERDRVHTFGESSERASRLADALRRLRIGRGDRVALLAQNELEYTEVQVGVTRAGATLVPLNWRLTGPELEFLVADSAPTLLIHGPGFEEAARQLGLRTWHLGPRGYGESYEERLAAAEPDPEIPMLAAQDASQIIYTSGTTGRPKGAIISNYALWARWNMFAIELAARPEHVFVQPLPMFHIAAHTGWAFTYVGATHVCIRTFEPQEVLDTIEARRATHLLLVPTMINALANHPGIDGADLSSLQNMFYGASAIAPEVLRLAIAKLGCDFTQFYGMTETSGCAILLPEDHDPESKPGLLPSAGRISLSYQVRVVDADDEDVPPGERGEVICRGPMLFDGYWGSPEATADAMRGGWMHTGDIGYIPEEGYLYVVDRIKDVVVSGGENVYPREVEDALYEHPEVLEAAVIGVPDDRWGEAAHAVVVPRPGTAPTEESILAHCRERLAGYKVPKSMELIEELPKNATGKIDRKLLREPHWKGRVRRVA